MSKIGILGGTFNPIHKEHLLIAQEAYEQFHLDQVWFMPNGMPPHKGLEGDISRKSRLEMVELAIRPYPYFKTYLWELQRLGKSYLYLTLEHLKETYPEDEFYFIIGQDSLSKLDTWVEPARILNSCQILVAVRSQDAPHSLNNAEDSLDPASSHGISIEDQIKQLDEKYHARIYKIQHVNNPISSTKIRRQVLEGDKAYKNDLPDAVSDYIEEHFLYRQDVSDQLLEEIRASLSKTLGNHRYWHTIGVMETCGQLAAYYGLNQNVAMLAGLLHDCAKYMSNEKLLEYSIKHKLGVTEAEEKSPHLLHAKVGAYFVSKKYKLDFPEIAHAICVHTTGCPAMNLLDQILFVADYIEPGRCEAPNLTDLRTLAYTDLDLTTAIILKDTMEYVSSKGQFMDEATVKTYEYYQNIISARKED